MKLALYWLSCCIAASWQQQNQRYGGYSYQAHQYPYGRPLSHYSGPYYPNFYNYPYYSNYFYPLSPSPEKSENQELFPNKQQTSPLNEEKAIQVLLMRLWLSQRLKQIEAKQEQRITNEQDEDSDGIVVHGQRKEDNQAMARVKNRQWFNKKPDQEFDDETAPRAFLLPNFLLRNQVLGTSTYYSLTTSTLTVTTIYSCIKASSFYGGSSQACRKRRSLAKLDLKSDEEHVDGSLLNPTPVESIEITPKVESAIVPRSAELDSSLYLQQARAGNGLNLLNSITGLYGKTLTSSVTTFSIITSVSYRTVSLGSNLSCLPAGFSVC